MSKQSDFNNEESDLATWVFENVKKSILENEKREKNVDKCLISSKITFVIGILTFEGTFNINDMLENHKDVQSVQVKEIAGFDLIGDLVKKIDKFIEGIVKKFQDLLNRAVNEIQTAMINNLSSLFIQLNQLVDKYPYLASGSVSATFGTQINQMGLSLTVSMSYERK